ncbi:MAG: O-antigen ligase family protein [Candidatus Promineifilaceae bacterium]
MLARRSAGAAPPRPRDWLRLGLAAGLAAVVAGLLLALGGPLAAGALLLALGAGYAVMRDLGLGFVGVVAVVCLLPFATIPVDVGLTPTLLDLALGATLGVWALSFASGKRRTMITSPITIPLLIFMLVALFAFIFGLANGPLTANLLRHFAELLLSIGFALVVVDYFSSWERLAQITRLLLLAGSAAALISILLWLLPDLVANDLLNVLQRVGYPGGLVIRYIEDDPEQAERAIGTAIDPNALGGLLLMIGSLAAGQLAARRPLFRRWQVLAMLALVGVALVLTFSRGAMLGLAAGALFLAVARYRRLIPYMLAALAFLLLLPASQDYVARFLAGFAGEDLATQMRFGEYRDALELISRYPLVGVGFAGSPDIDLYLGVASVYLTIGGQMGILGLVAFAAVLIALFGAFIAHRRALQANQRLISIWLGLHAAVAGALVAGFFDHYLFNIDFHHAVTVFWLFLGLAAAASRTGAAEE